MIRKLLEKLKKDTLPVRSQIRELETIKKQTKALVSETLIKDGSHSADTNIESHANKKEHSLKKLSHGPHVKPYEGNHEEDMKAAKADGESSGKESTHEGADASTEEKTVPLAVVKDEKAGGCCSSDAHATSCSTDKSCKGSDSSKSSHEKKAASKTVASVVEEENKFITADDLKTEIKPTWCPGCGDFGIWFAIKKALQRIKIPQEDLMIVYGIGCHGHMCNFVHAYGFEGLHGRPIPVAEGIKMANNKLKVIVVAGDGDTYGEGLNHFLSSVRGNHDITVIVHNNMVYGLTTGQTSPTSEKGYHSKSTPGGVIEEPINPIALALAANGSFVARGFSGKIQELADLMEKAINHNGFSLVDVFQNCVSFNHHNTIHWFMERVYDLQKEGHNKHDKMKAMEKAFEWGDRLPTGIFYEEKKKSYEDALGKLEETPLVDHATEGMDLTKTFEKFV